MATRRHEADRGVSDSITGKPGFATAALPGAAGGLYGAAAMSVLRLGLHRAGVIDKVVTQVVEEWISDRLHIDPPGGRSGITCRPAPASRIWRQPGSHRRAAAEQRRRARRPMAGAAVGLATWAFGMLVLVPALRVARAPWKADSLENAIGWAIQLVEEPARQRHRTRTSDAERMRDGVG